MFYWLLEVGAGLRGARVSLSFGTSATAVLAGAETARDELSPSWDQDGLTLHSSQLGRAGGGATPSSMFPATMAG